MSGDPPDPGETETAAAIPAARHRSELGAGQGPPDNGVKVAGHQPPGAATGVCPPTGPAGADTPAPGPAGADTPAPGPAGADTPAAPGPAGADTPVSATGCYPEGNQNGFKKQVAIL